MFKLLEENMSEETDGIQSSASSSTAIQKACPNLCRYSSQRDWLTSILFITTTYSSPLSPPLLGNCISLWTPVKTLGQIKLWYMLITQVRRPYSIWPRGCLSSWRLHLQEQPRVGKGEEPDNTSLNCPHNFQFFWASETAWDQCSFYF